MRTQQLVPWVDTEYVQTSIDKCVTTSYSLVEQYNSFQLVRIISNIWLDRQLKNNVQQFILLTPRRIAFTRHRLWSENVSVQ